MNPKLRDIIGFFIPDYARLRFEWINMREILLFGEYKWLATNCRPNTVAVDFGAGVGESAIYLARAKNIKMVYAFEPNKDHFNTARNYVKRAGLSSKIILFNELAHFMNFKSNRIIVKSNCAGAEHGLFTEDTKMNGVYRIQMAYRNGVGMLADTLRKKGFSVTVKKGEEGLLIGKTGMIYAERKQKHAARKR